MMRKSLAEDMQMYLQRLKCMKHDEAAQLAFRNLVDAKIIFENGDYTDRYVYTKACCESSLLQRG